MLHLRDGRVYLLVRHLGPLPGPPSLRISGSIVAAVVAAAFRPWHRGHSSVSPPCYRQLARHDLAPLLSGSSRSSLPPVSASLLKGDEQAAPNGSSIATSPVARPARLPRSGAAHHHPHHAHLSLLHHALQQRQHGGAAPRATS